MYARLFFSAVACLVLLTCSPLVQNAAAQSAKASICDSCADSPSCCSNGGCQCGHGGPLSNLKDRLSCCCCGYLPIPVLASGNMPQRQQYHNGPNGAYYFRPYNSSTIARQQGEATWAKRPGLPYSNDVFKNVYAQVQAGGGQPVYVAPQPELIPAPVDNAPTRAQPPVGTGAVQPGNMSLPTQVTPVPVTPSPSTPRPLTPRPVSPLLPGPPTP